MVIVVGRTHRLKSSSSAIQERRVRSHIESGIAYVKSGLFCLEEGSYAKDDFIQGSIPEGRCTLEVQTAFP